MTLEHIAYRCGGGLETQLQELAFDLVISPAGVLTRQAKDQVLQLLVYSWSPTLVLPRMAPLPAHQFAMPTKHRFRLEYANDITQSTRRSLRGLFQFGSEKRQRHLLNSVGPDRLTLFALQDRQLLAQNKDLQVLFSFG
jgi:hypothetical protein